MHIKQLEVSGFKSFVDRTVVHFDHDVIGIVGPNGCGKSNIVDAIRWCMGEQSAKHLRGKAMTDVIFSGSENRGPHGVADVTITFDNSDQEAAQTLPIEYRDYPEIAVTRRLYRDGTSEYLINKTQVRLKDVTDLFLGTGVGTKAYSIVEQGKIGLIVSARPEDRRLLIEEAAGITKYKHRRKQAEQKMDATRQNLARVGDIVGEIERSLGSLRRQAAKAERYKAYRTELEGLMLHEASHRYIELTVMSQFEADTLATVSQEADQARDEVAGREAASESARLLVYDLEAKTDAATKEEFAAKSEVRRLEADIERAKDKLEAVHRREKQAVEEKEDLEVQAESLENERRTLRDKLATMEENEREEASIGLETHEQLEALRSEQQVAERNLGELRNRAAQAQAQVASAQAKLDGFGRRTSEMQMRREKLAFEQDSLRGESQELAARREALAQSLVELAEGKQMSAEEKVALEAELKTLRETIVGTERDLEQSKNELSQKRNRLRALEEVSKRLEGVGAGTKYLINTKDETIVGLVLDRLEAPRELTQALAGLLGERLQDVVVRDVARGAELLARMFVEKKGRAAIVSQRPRFVAGLDARIEGAGVLGRLADRVRYAPEDAALASALIGGAVVVETVAHAIALGPVSVPLVCLDGTVLHPDGRVVGGAGDAVAAGMLEQHREMRELNEVVATLSDVVTAKIEAHQALRVRTTEVTTQLERARQQAHEHELAHLTTEKDLRRAEDQLAAAMRRLDALATETQDLDDKLAEAADEESDARRLLEEGEEALGHVKSEHENAEYVAEEWRERVSAQQAVVTEYKVRLAQLREQASAVRDTVERLSRSTDELFGRVRKIDEELDQGAMVAGVSAAVLMMARAEMGAAVSLARETEAALSQTRQTFEEAKLDLQIREGDLKDLRARAHALAEARTKHDKTLERHLLAMQHLLEGVAEKFRGLDLRRVIGDYHAKPMVDDEHRARISELGGLIDRMGSVNLDAMRECEEEEKRFSFYDTQKKDLESALADLEAAIAQMDQESKRLFAETFEAVNRNFQTIFPRMFRGGNAMLKLTNPEDMLETGIEILAQPPGKKLANIELMSGGEKALTAVSLIFAMFQHKPSPFCILDEVDAPLDEANVARYNEAIRSMTDKSQFILITHIKRTMQSVDVLYGVTMQEPGVSKLVSVKVNEQAGKRSAAPQVGGDAAVA